MEQSKAQVLEEKLGKYKANKLIRLIKDCDNYLTKFKEEARPLLEALGQEVKVGIHFAEKPKGD